MTTFFSDSTIAVNNALNEFGMSQGIYVFLDGDPSGVDSDTRYVSKYTLSSDGITADIGYSEEYTQLLQLNASASMSSGESGVNAIVDSLRDRFGIGQTMMHGMACVMVDGFFSVETGYRKWAAN